MRRRVAVAALAIWCFGCSEPSGPGGLVPIRNEIVFASDRSGQFQLYVMRPDGTNVRRLPVPLSHPADMPTVSPDGTRLAFRMIVPGQGTDVFVMNVDGTGFKRLTPCCASDGWPAWSPDGSRIAFQSNRDGNFEIYLMNPDGTGQVNLTRSPVRDDTPAWSPDGQRISFTRSGEIYLMNADGTGVVNLTLHPASDCCASWSPDGRFIAFDSTRDGLGNQLWIMGVDGSNPTLVPSIGSPVMASWSPDSRSLVIGGADIYRVNADGSGSVNLTADSPAIDFDPWWAR